MIPAEPAASGAGGSAAAPLLGVVGGLGPLASAEFLRTLYRLHVGEREQEAPRVLLYSDPSFPDRTEALLAGAEQELCGRLATVVDALLAAGARRVLVTCFTIHHVLPRLPPRLAEAVISLVGLALDAAVADPRPRLLLSTAGTRACGVFEAHPKWRQASRTLTLLHEPDQHRLHRWIYALKRQEPAEPVLDWLAERAAAYRVDGFLFGCTELHLLQPMLASRSEPWAAGVLDPLLAAARLLPSLLAGGEDRGRRPLAATGG